MDKNKQNLQPQLLCVICNYSKRDKLEKLMLKATPLSFTTHGHGSATSELLDYLGIGEQKKQIALAIADLKAVPHIYTLLDEGLGITKKGLGIAFTTPLSSMNGLLYKVYTGADITEGGKAEMKTEMEMILTIVDKGGFGAVMDAAKGAGAKGGTLIHAKGLGGKEAEKFLGITINQEKDVVMILAPTNQKHGIMEAINKNLVIDQAGKGICFALPVSTAFGLTPQG